VLIGGDGADELFGGYEFYKTISSNFSPNSNPSPYSGFVNNPITFSNWTTDKLREKMKSNWLEANNNYGFEEDQYERLMQAVLYSDTTIQLESVGIRAADTMSMMHSVESRSFFLGQEVMRFALNLPLSHKVDLSMNGLEITKPLLKKLFIRCFGHELLMPKQGFSGYPNEAGRALLASMGSSGFPLTMEYLNLNLNNHIIDTDYALEWKMINVELFLNVFADRM
jgi:asparagine synthetase B (glutamine-hydrolysing)